MEKLHYFRNIYSKSSAVVPLVLITFITLIIVLVFIFFNYSRVISQMDDALTLQHNESRKMKINSELMQIARNRTRITGEIINSSDPFEKDELNVQLENYAGIFSKLKSDLNRLPLNNEELEILDKADSIISEILPAQRYSVELSIEEKDRKTSEDLLYQVVLPGQDKLIELFSKLVSLEQKKITSLTESSHILFKDINDQIQYVSIALITISVILALTVVARIKRIQLELRVYSKTLEQINANQENIINERTSELQALNLLLKETSERDELTGLYNRRKFNVFLADECERSVRLNTPFALILIDIDHFKLYNDNYGHTEGDDCLATVARIMSESLPRAVDFIARYGGEEFAIILPATDITGARKVANIIRQAVIDAQLPHKHSKTAEYVTISQGVAIFQHDSPQAISELINQADEMLYQAKENGRNRVEPQ